MGATKKVSESIGSIQVTETATASVESSTGLADQTKELTALIRRLRE